MCFIAYNKCQCGGGLYVSWHDMSWSRSWLVQLWGTGNGTGQGQGRPGWNYSCWMSVTSAVWDILHIKLHLGSFWSEHLQVTWVELANITSLKYKLICFTVHPFPHFWRCLVEMKVGSFPAQHAPTWACSEVRMLNLWHHSNSPGNRAMSQTSASDSLQHPPAEVGQSGRKLLFYNRSLQKWQRNGAEGNGLKHLAWRHDLFVEVFPSVTSL